LTLILKKHILGRMIINRENNYNDYLQKKLIFVVLYTFK